MWAFFRTAIHTKRGVPFIGVVCKILCDWCGSNDKNSVQRREWTWGEKGWEMDRRKLFYGSLLVLLQTKNDRASMGNTISFLLSLTSYYTKWTHRELSGFCMICLSSWISVKSCKNICILMIHKVCWGFLESYHVVRPSRHICWYSSPEEKTASSDKNAIDSYTLEIFWPQAWNI